MKSLIFLSSIVLAVYANTVCYNELGCFSNEPPFRDMPDRPISYLPQSREDVGTTFLLNTPTNPAAYDYLSTYDLTSITNSNLNPFLHTKVIVHGYTENGYVDWMREMMEACLQQGNYNVIRVNWSKGAVGLYGVSTSNTRIVGAEISLLMDKIRVEVYPGTYVADPATWHIIGHSLGAHVSGYAGERQNGLGRITGMDPAGPYFEDTDLMVRLDPTDALFVDAIHTDTDPIYTIGLGIHMEVGHMDFYVNGGREQPGCDQGLIERIVFGDGGLYDAGVQFVACNHLRSYEYFTESILSSCPFGFRKATSLDYDNYFVPHSFYDENSGAKMGFYADQYKPPPGVTNVIYMGDTMDCAPYCAYQHRAKVRFDDPNLRTDDAVGDIYLRLKGSKGESYQMVGSGTYKPGTETYFPVDLTVDVGTVYEVDFYWEFDPEWYKPWEWSLFDNPDIYVSEIDLESLEFFQDYQFCGSSDKIKSNRDIRALTPC
ncbi:Pancreatic lipase-related protein 2 [Holothuria leucospilota]|uniref:Pancreatic lipase-related protein 2 n=1 Tax=Holothuria leucospilota TaxID=206669 RepID=A0A9Q1HC23_HOLLE|nr:Pancreatic lipase-related protein 2 [Holothuria leucospilota]